LEGTEIVFYLADNLETEKRFRAGDETVLRRSHYDFDGDADAVGVLGVEEYRAEASIPCDAVEGSGLAAGCVC